MAIYNESKKWKCRSVRIIPLPKEVPWTKMTLMGGGQVRQQWQHTCYQYCTGCSVHLLYLEIKCTFQGSLLPCSTTCCYFLLEHQEYFLFSEKANVLLSLWEPEFVHFLADSIPMNKNFSTLSALLNFSHYYVSICWANSIFAVAQTGLYGGNDILGNFSRRE